MRTNKQSESENSRKNKNHLKPIFVIRLGMIKNIFVSLKGKLLELSNNICLCAFLLLLIFSSLAQTLAINTW